MVTGWPGLQVVLRRIGQVTWTGVKVLVVMCSTGFAPGSGRCYLANRAQIPGKVLCARSDRSCRAVSDDLQALAWATLLHFVLREGL